MSSIRSASSRIEHADAVERDDLPLDQVLQAAGRGDEDVRFARGLRLRADRDAAVDRGDPEVARRRDRADLGGHLRGELARGDEHERRTAVRRPRRAARRAARRRRASCPSPSATSRARRGRRARPAGRAPEFGRERGCRARRAPARRARTHPARGKTAYSVRLLRDSVEIRLPRPPVPCTGRTEEEQTSLDDTTPSVTTQSSSRHADARVISHDLVRARRARTGVPRRGAARRLRAVGDRARPGGARLRPGRRLRRRCASGSARGTASSRRASSSRTAASRASSSTPRSCWPSGPGRVLVEAPTYDRPLKILARLGADVVPSRWTRKGSTPTRSSASSPPARRASSTRSRPSRTRAAARSRPSGAGASSSSPPTHGVPVLEDDPYGLVRYEGEAPPSLHELEGGELVTYASSFSKTVAPGRARRLVRRAGRRSRRGSRRARSRPTSRRRSSPRRRCTS